MAHIPTHIEEGNDPQFPTLVPSIKASEEDISLETKRGLSPIGGTPIDVDYQAYLNQLGADFKPALGEEYNKELLAEKQERERIAKYENQSALEQFGNVVFGGLSKGGLTLLENVGYIADIAEWTGLSDEEDKAYSNWLSELAKEGKGGIDEVMPIHTMETGDFGYWMQQAQGLIDSAVGYGLTGAGSGLLVRSMAGARSAYAGYDVAKNVAAASMMNYAESKTMSIELFKNSYGDLYEQFRKDGLVHDDAHRKASNIASKEANDFIWNNKINIMTDYLQFKSLYRGHQFTRNLVMEGKRNKSLDLLAEAGKESFEEVSSGALQSEGEYQARVEGGLDVSDYSSTMVGRAADYAFSSQGLTEALMGALGGPVQSYLVNKPIEYLSDKNYSQKQKERGERQETIIKDNEKALFDSINNFSKNQVARQQAIKEGNDIVVQNMVDEDFVDLAHKNFVAGTTEKLEEQIERIQSLSPEEAKQQGLDDNYSSTASKQLQDLKRLEKEYIKEARKIDADENPGFVEHLFNIKARRDYAQKGLIESRQAVVAKTSEVVSKATALTGQPISDLQLQEAIIDDKISYLESIKIEDEKAKASNDKRIAELKKAKESLKIEGSISADKLNSISEFDDLLSLSRQSEILNLNNNVYSESYDYYSKKENRDKEAKKLEEEMKEKANAAAKAAAKRQAREKTENAKTVIKEETSVPRPDTGREEQETIPPPVEEEYDEDYEEGEEDVNDADQNIIENALTGKTTPDYYKLSEATNTWEELAPLIDEAEKSGVFTPELEAHMNKQMDRIDAAEKEKIAKSKNADAKDILTTTNTESDTGYHGDDLLRNGKNDNVNKTQTSLNNSEDEKDVNDTNGNPLISDRKLLGATSTVAYGYSRGFMDVDGDKTMTTSNELGQLSNQAVLASDTILEGDILTVRLLKPSEFESYQQRGDKVIYDEKGNEVDVIKDGTLITYDKLMELGPLYAPIGYFDERGNLIGTKHDVSYITSKRVVKEEIENDRANMIKERNLIYSNPNETYTVTIEHKTKGIIAKNAKNKQRTTSEALPNLTTVAIASGSQTLKTGTDSDTEISVVNKKDFIPGKTYAIVKAPDGSTVALPINNIKLSREHIDTIKKVIISFYKKTREQVDTDVLNAIFGKEPSPAEVITYLKQFLYSADISKVVTDGKFDLSTGKRDRYYFSMGTDDIKFGYSNSKLFHIGTKIEFVGDQLLQALDIVLTNSYYGFSLKGMVEHENKPLQLVYFDQEGKVTTKKYDNYVDYIKDYTETNLNEVMITYKDSKGKEKTEPVYFDNPVIITSPLIDSNLLPKTDVEVIKVAPKVGEEQQKKKKSKARTHDMFGAIPKVKPTASDIANHLKKKADDVDDKDVKSKKDNC